MPFGSDMKKALRIILSLAVMIIFDHALELSSLVLSADPAAGISESNSSRSGSKNIYFDGVDPASKPVMQKAQEDIEKYRKGDFSVQFVDEKGLPITGNAQIQLQRHEFQFGANIFLIAALKNQKLRKKAFDVVDELFSTVTIGNYWRQAEKTRGEAPDWTMTDLPIQWAKDHGKQMRFHCLIYNTPFAMPDWAGDVPTEKEWWSLIEKRIETVAQKYGRLVDEYDVLNEVISNFGWASKRTPHFPDMRRPENAKRVFEIARKYLPDAQLVILDYILAKNTHRLFSSLYEYYDNLLKMNTPIDVIGYQGHYYSDGTTPFHAGHRRLGSDAFTMKSINAEFENLAGLGKPVHITEFNPPSRKKRFGAGQPVLTDDEIAAWEVNYYTLAFSKPYIHQLVRWHVVDGWTSGLDAGLIRMDDRLKPSYHAIKKLIKTTWSTNWQGELVNGNASFRGFYGNYSARVQGYPVVDFVFFANDRKNQKVILTAK